MKIAVVGAGISGMGAALALQEAHEVVLFEKNTRLGGHANTVDIAYPHPKGGTRPIAVDTGFIVYNNKTYPNLTAMFEHLDVPTEWSDMSLSFCIDDGKIEWAADNLDKIFAQRSNILSPKFVGAVREILRFNREAKACLAGEASAADYLPLSDWLDAKKFSAAFRKYYLYPMAGAIWSTRSEDIAAFPARALFGFYENHDLLIGIGDAVQWRTVTGGSRAYVERVAHALGSRVRLDADVQRVESLPTGGVMLYVEGAEPERFDGAVMATHSDEALAICTNADGEARQLLSDVRYTPNRAVLHRDASFMPRRRKVWSSWNTNVGPNAETKGASLTYWMNRLQNIDRDMPLFVSLNPDREPDPELVFSEHSYAHPYFDSAALDAQGRFDGVQGRGDIWFAGAWLGYGFHEDGLRAGLRAAALIGVQPSWARDIGGPLPEMRIAAE